MVHRLTFPAAMWLLSRIFITAAMLLVAPLLPDPPGGEAVTFGWDVFSALDSEYYQQIATAGYEYVNDGKGHNVAFFPLFPLLMRGFITLGLPVEVAGTLVNNLAFFVMLLVLYCWAEEQYGKSAARWITVVMAWCPLSLFGTVIYSEGLFLLFSTAALRAFDQKQYVWVCLWGAITTAARPTGMALIPALAIASWQERRKAIAYVASFAAAGGLLLYSLYCGIRFGDFLAFSHAQQGWKRSLGIDWQGWFKMLMQITVGNTNWKHGAIIDPVHPLLFSIIIVLGYLLWRWRHKFSSSGVVYGFCALGLFLWLLAGDPLINTVMLFGGGFLLWHLRTWLTFVTLSYGFCGLGLLLFSGSTWSLSRLVYGIVSSAIALGLLLSRHPRWAYITIGFFVILLASYSVRFAQNLWVA